MQNAIGRIEFPELFFGIVTPVGAETEPTIRALTTYFINEKYRVVPIKITDYFYTISRTIRPKTDLKKFPTDSRIETYIQYGNQIRETFKDDSVLASYTIFRISKDRRRYLKSEPDNTYQRTAYILYQFKRKEEIDVLRSVYGNLFFQVSVYSKRESRIAYLSKKLAHEYNTADQAFYRTKANALIMRDEDEKDNERGQRVTKIFHDADFIVNNDLINTSIESQISRFCELIFSSNKVSPTKYEYAMFAAKVTCHRFFGPF